MAWFSEPFTTIQVASPHGAEVVPSLCGRKCGLCRGRGEHCAPTGRGSVHDFSIPQASKGISNHEYHKARTVVRLETMGLNVCDKMISEDSSSNDNVKEQDDDTNHDSRKIAGRKQ